MRIRPLLPIQGRLGGGVPGGILLPVGADDVLTLMTLEHPGSRAA
jgi:hypothetical protein